MKLRAMLAAGIGAAVVLLSAACGGGGEGGGGGIGGTGVTPAGTLRVALTDAPACGYDAVHVTITAVRVHASDAAGDADAGWTEIAVLPRRRIDLLTLTDGVIEPLGQSELPAGRYTQMRLVLAPDDGSVPPANAVTPSGSVEVPLDTPGATQSGVKLQTGFDVAPGQVRDVVLDFDACKSIVPRGSSGRYNLHPVIAVIVLP